jgi:hypothetical protein
MTKSKIIGTIKGTSSGVRATLPRLAAATLTAAATFGLALPANAAITPTQPAMDSITLAPGATHEFILTCGPGHKAVGGGWLTETTYVRVWRSWPDANNDRTWRITATSFNSIPEKVWANATCATGFFSLANVAGNTGNIAPGTYRTGTATCDSTRKAMGGGFIAPNTAFPIVSSYLEPTANGWRVRAYNGGSGSNQVGVLVTCSNSLGTRTIYTEQTTVQPNGAAFPIMTCPSGKWLASGGFKSTVDTFWTIVTGSLPYSQNWLSWKWNLKNLDTVPHTYDRTLVCFNL